MTYCTCDGQIWSFSVFSLFKHASLFLFVCVFAASVSTLMRCSLAACWIYFTLHWTSRIAFLCSPSSLTSRLIYKTNLPKCKWKWWSLRISSIRREQKKWPVLQIHFHTVFLSVLVYIYLNDSTYFIANSAYFTHLWVSLLVFVQNRISSYIFIIIIIVIVLGVKGP